ncbi:L-threonylcarbamoyladenylate synthase [Allonocardiopsis opalescens]|uniref:L-threonylcarbamoyladenylate synthase n=1 Tax=Allonocardiopsis opalescens TaxID=1144618 RepID=A0A2T0QD09_9ACTN|nr:L-threonylcarbamoyladenylate synthase [Allonocardiopsis opalescens]PRY01782.1 translation factor SUA5 [Allonocardiopsis opalescens]
MSRSYDCSVDFERKAGLSDAASVVRRGELVVLPTDTVYGIGCDAFTPGAVRSLLAAKGRGREMPPPVLVGSVRAATSLITDLGAFGQDLIDEFWPGALTIVCTANPSLSWDLGDTRGTVALRMPMHPVALDLLKEVGPMAVSSANRTGRPPARTAQEAREQLEDRVEVYLESGPSADTVPSTIVDLTYAVPRVLREGAIPVDRLRQVVGSILGVDEEDGDDAAPAADSAAAAPDTESAAPRTDAEEAPERGDGGEPPHRDHGPSASGD